MRYMLAKYFWVWFIFFIDYVLRNAIAIVEACKFSMHADLSLKIYYNEYNKNFYCMQIIYFLFYESSLHSRNRNSLTFFHKHKNYKIFYKKKFFIYVRSRNFIQLFSKIAFFSKKSRKFQVTIPVNFLGSGWW